MMIRVDQVIDSLASFHKRLTKHPLGTIGLMFFGALCGVGLQDAYSHGSILLPDNSLTRKAELSMLKTLKETGAERAMLARFLGDSRESVAVRAREGVKNVLKPNRYISLSEPGYSELHSAHLEGQCWAYEPPATPPKTSLEIGMNSLGAKLLIACPVYDSGDLWGSISVSFDSELLDPEKALNSLKQRSKTYSSLVEESK